MNGRNDSALVEKVNAIATTMCNYLQPRHAYSARGADRTYSVSQHVGGKRLYVGKKMPGYPFGLGTQGVFSGSTDQRMAVEFLEDWRKWLGPLVQREVDFSKTLTDVAEGALGALS